MLHHRCACAGNGGAAAAEGPASTGSPFIFNPLAARKLEGQAAAAAAAATLV